MLRRESSGRDESLAQSRVRLSGWGVLVLALAAANRTQESLVGVLW